MGNCVGFRKKSRIGRDSAIHEVNASSPRSHSPPGIDLIIPNFAKVDGTGQIDLLISFIDYQIEKIKRGDEASSSFSGEIESVASCTSLAAQIIEIISEEAENLKNKNLVRAMGDVAFRAMKSIGESNWIFIGVSAVAYALESYAKTESNTPEYIELLHNIAELAQDTKKMGGTTPAQTERLSKAVQMILEGTVIFCDCIAKGDNSRYRSVLTRQIQVQKTIEAIKYARCSIILTEVIRLSTQLTRRLRPSPLEFIGFNPEGIEKQVAEVQKLLDMDGSEPAIAVVLCGYAGVGKSTLAASVTKQLDFASTDIKFCRIMIDENTPDKTAHAVKLQSDIIRDFTGRKLDLRNPGDGRKQLEKAITNQSCFLFIDNVTDIDYIRKLLPRQLLPVEENTPVPPVERFFVQRVLLFIGYCIQSCITFLVFWWVFWRGRTESEAVTETEDNSVTGSRPRSGLRLRVLITSRERNLRHVLNIHPYKEYQVQPLPSDTAKTLIRKIILQHESEVDGHSEDEMKVYEHFDEAGLIDAVADACGGVPLLLNRLGNHLRFNRDKGSYEAVLKAFTDGNLVSFGLGLESLIHTFFSIYNAMQPEAQEAFLDICAYFQGLDWDVVGHSVGREQLEALHRMALITRTNSNTVIVHDMFRAIGLKEGKGSRISNYEELIDAIEDESKLKNVKGLAFLSDISSTTIESRHLNAMHHSLRVLHLGDLVSVDGPPCDKPFNNLRYLRLGVVGVFPFADASNIGNLKVFLNASKPVMDCGQLPRSLKIIRYQVPDELDAFVNLQPENLGSFEWFRVKIIQVKLSQELKFPASLKILDLNNCKQVPENFSHLTALEHLSMDKCTLTSIPQGLEKLVKLKHLSMTYCTNLDTGGLMLPESLEILDLSSCKHIPDNFCHLTSLEHLTLDKCDMKSLSQGLEKLTRLKHLSMKDCTNMQKKGLILPATLKVLDLSSCKQLPEIFSSVTDLEHLILDKCDIEIFPPGLEQLGRLKYLSMNYCTNMTSLPDAVGKLTQLKELNMRECENLRALPDDLSELSSLQSIDITGCINLYSLPDSFGRLPIQSLNLESLVSLNILSPSMGNMSFLKTVTFISCISLTSLPDSFVYLKKLEILRIERCNKLVVLPKDFEQLSSLKEMIVEDCLSLKELPDRFHSLPSLKMLSLIRCNRLKNLPEEFGKLTCLEELRLEELSLSRLPDGFAELQSLKVLWILNCYRLEKLGHHEFENLASLRHVKLKYCTELEGTVMERLVKLQHCELLDIEESSNLVERWKEMQQREEESWYPTLVITSSIEEEEEDSKGQQECVLAETAEDKLGCFMVEMTTDDPDNRHFTSQQVSGTVENEIIQEDPDDLSPSQN